MKFYLAFYKANCKKAHWDDKIINWWTGSIGFSHVEIVIDYENGKMVMLSSSPRDGGVRMKEHRYDESIWEYVEVDLTLSHVMNIFKLTDGAKYDWMGILGFVIPFKDSTKDWFCSEWCSNVLKTYGNEKLLLLEPSKISPNKLYTLMKS